MGWSFFKKKEEENEIDPLRDLVVTNLQVNWMVDYEMKTWEVIASHKYDWGSGKLTTEWELRSGNETIFLEYVAEDGEYFMVSRKIPIGKIDGNVKSYLQTHEEAPQRVVLDGETYYLDEEGGGIFLENGRRPGHEFLFWDFVDDADKKFVTIEQYSDTEFEAYAGIYAEEYEFSNVLPRE